MIEVAAQLRPRARRGALRWSAPEAGTISIDNPDAARTKVRGIVPGVHDLDVDLLDGGGTRIASMKLKLSVPQCVQMTEDAAAFDQALADSQLAGQKAAVVTEMKATLEALLAKTNARVFWQVGGLNEALPAHVPAANVNVVTLQEQGRQDGAVGRTTGPAAGDPFNETIYLFPGMYPDPDAIDVDTETTALILELASSIGGNPALLAVAVKVFGRLIGETAAHEIGHALLWDDIATGHNSPAIPHDLMNQGVDRVFIERTGMENTAQVSPVLPTHYKDHGYAPDQPVPGGQPGAGRPAVAGAAALRLSRGSTEPAAQVPGWTRFRAVATLTTPTKLKLAYAGLAATDSWLSGLPGRRCPSRQVRDQAAADAHAGRIAGHLAASRRLAAADHHACRPGRRVGWGRRPARRREAAVPRRDRVVRARPPGLPGRVRAARSKSPVTTDPRLAPSPRPGRWPLRRWR